MEFPTQTTSTSTSNNNDQNNNNEKTIKHLMLSMLKTTEKKSDNDLIFKLLMQYNPIQLVMLTALFN